MEETDNLKSNRDKEFKPLERRSIPSALDAILKKPEQIIYELQDIKNATIPIYLIIISTLCLLAIGLMMGSFSGGSQLWRVPVKVVAGFYMSLIMCMPSLYIMLCLSGGTQSFVQTARLSLITISLAGILFIGFLPVVWIFSQATNATSFMGILYLFIWGIGLFFGLKLLKRAFTYLNGKPMKTLNLWVAVFVLVILQMSTTIRPLLGTYDSEMPKTKKFFLSHWLDVASQ